MTALWPRLKSHFVNWREWELNPMVVKELRQAVRSWSVTGMLLLFLLVLFVTALGMMAMNSFEVYGNKQLGGEVFQAFVAVLATASLGFIPLYLGVRLATERQENNLDLLYISTLTPGRVIRGKFFCGAYIALLFFSACMPFMAFTSLLRGVDLPSIFAVLVFLFLAVCAMNQVAIFVACLPASRPFKVLLGLVVLGLCIAAIFPVVLSSIEMMRSGVGAMMGARTFWIAFGTGFGTALAVAVLLYFLSVALISPASANRARPVRVYLTALWLLSAAVSFRWMWREHDVRMLLPWGITSFLVLTIALLAVISGHDNLSLRVQREIPARGLRRALAFLVFNGAAGGVAWVLILMFLTYALTMYFQFAPPSGWKTVHTFNPEELTEFYLVGTSTVLYTIAYALTALFLQRTFSKKLPAKSTGVLAILLAGGWALLPNLTLFFINKFSWNILETLQLGNLFNVFSVRKEMHRTYHVWFALGWVLLMVALNVRWFIASFRAFRPLARKQSRQTAPPVPAETGP